MRSDGLRIIKATTTFSTGGSGYDSTHSYMYGYELDIERKTAVLMRQSRRGGSQINPESRLRQEGLGRVAVEIRADHDPLMVLPCDEGSGVSGQKKIYERPKMLELWQAIQNGSVGSVIVAREDRLFRDRYLTQATQFAEECAKRRVLLIVAGRRCYDFRIPDDFNDFIRKMQEAYSYIDTHIKYMQQMHQQKLARGEWVGGGIVAPYALDRSAIVAAHELRKTIKEFGASEEDERQITKAFRPVIYEPWHQIAIDVFEQFRLFDYSPARIGRWVESIPYIFPLPQAEDIQCYSFNIQMHLVPGRGYTFAASHRVATWLRNLMHLGYMSVGKDEDGNRVYIADAFDAAIPRDLFEPCYEAITGFTLDGEPSNMARNRSRFVRKLSPEQKNALLTQHFRSPDVPMNFQAKFDQTGVMCYFGRLKQSGEYGVSRWESGVLWTLPAAIFDQSVVTRLAALAEHDTQLADRVEQYYKELTKQKSTEKQTILNDIASLQTIISGYDKMIFHPPTPITEAQRIHYIELQAGAMNELTNAETALGRYEHSQPTGFIPAFYRILGRLGKEPGEFWKLPVDKQRHMLSLLIDEIQITNISPHLYRLLLKWKDPVAERWDCALIYRRQAVRTERLGEQEWSREEDERLGELWGTADKLDIYKALPTKSGWTIKTRASFLGVRRDEVWRHRPTILHRALCYADWSSACRAIEVELESDEGRKVLEMLNYYARTTPTKQRAALWWILPVVEMNNLDSSLINPACW